MPHAKPCSGSPTEPDELVRRYLLTPADHDLVRTRRRPENRLGLAVHVSLLRYPGQGWKENSPLPAELVTWLGEQIQVEPDVLQDYARRSNTRHEHHALALSHLGLTPFAADHMGIAADIAAKAAFSTDHGAKIIEVLIAELREAPPGAPEHQYAGTSRSEGTSTGTAGGGHGTP